MKKLTKLVARLFGRPIPDETGEANAHRFVQTVAELALEERVIICHPRPAVGGGVSRTHEWIWMLNPLWRDRVMELLQDAPVRNAEFTPPDDLDGWTFTAYSTAPVPRIAMLQLDQSL